MYLSLSLSLSQCRDGVGACPDTLDLSGTCTNDVTLIQGFRQDGQQCVVFSRNFDAGIMTALPLLLVVS